MEIKVFSMLSSSTKKIMFISVLHVRNFNVNNKLEVKLMKIFIGKFYDFFLINRFFLIIAQSRILNFVIFNFNRLKYIYRYIRSNYMKKIFVYKARNNLFQFHFYRIRNIKIPRIIYIRVNKFHFIIFNWLFFPNTNVIY